MANIPGAVVEQIRRVVPASHAHLIAREALDKGSRSTSLRD